MTEITKEEIDKIIEDNKIQMEKEHSEKEEKLRKRMPEYIRRLVLTVDSLPRKYTYIPPYSPIDGRYGEQVDKKIRDVEQRLWIDDLRIKLWIKLSVDDKHCLHIVEEFSASLPISAVKDELERQIEEMLFAHEREEYAKNRDEQLRLMTEKQVNETPWYERLFL